MNIKRFAACAAYLPPKHTGMKAMRLQGFEPNGPANFWVALSHYLPGGGAGPDSSPLEKVYVVVAGHMTVRVEGKEFVLAAFDSCRIAPHEIREVRNESKAPATMIVVNPYATATP